MLVRPAVAGDLASISALFADNECLRALGKAQSRQDLIDIGDGYVSGVLKTELCSWNACTARYAGEGSALWVLDEGGDGCIGTIGCIEEGEEIELVRMYVAQERQRRGCGRQLFDVLHTHARSRGARKLKLTTPVANEPGIAFYRSLGFAQASSFTVHDFAPHALEIAAMEMALDDGAASLLAAPASAVHAHFARQVGATDAEQIERMRTLGLEGLEELQAVAEEVNLNGRDAEAKHAGMTWATVISTLIA